MYFRINHSCDPKVIGNVNTQTEHALFDVDIKHPNLSRNILFKKIEDSKSIITITPVLTRNAKLTDLISGSANGNGAIQLMISNKLKEILSAENHKGLHFFPMSIIFAQKERKGYWLTNPFYFDYNYIDFSKSIVNLYDIQDYTFKKQLGILNSDDFITKVSEVHPPKYVKVENLHFKSGTKDLLILRWVNGGVGYYVSEKLKKEIEDAGCTGIDFEPV